MANSYVPTNDAERATCITAVDDLAATPGLHPVLQVGIGDLFAPARDTYELRRVECDAASAAFERGVDERAAAEALFAEAFHRWLDSAIYLGGEAIVMRDLRALLGDVPPSRFLGLGSRVRTERMARVAAHVRARPHLLGDVARFDALIAATATLEAAVASQEVATRTRTASVQARNLAAAAFDRAYAHLHRAVRQLRPDLLGELPTFHRATAERAPAAPPAAAAPEVAPTPAAAPAPAPAEVEAAEPEPTLTLVQAA